MKKLMKVVLCALCFVPCTARQVCGNCPKGDFGHYGETQTVASRAF